MIFEKRRIKTLLLTSVIMEAQSFKEVLHKLYLLLREFYRRLISWMETVHSKVVLCLNNQKCSQLQTCTLLTNPNLTIEKRVV